MTSERKGGLLDQPRSRATAGAELGVEDRSLEIADCPRCGRRCSYYNGTRPREHWGLCDACSVRWWMGNDSPTWDLESAEGRAASGEKLAGFPEVMHPTADPVAVRGVLREHPLRDLRIWQANGTPVDELSLADYFFREQQRLFGASRRTDDGFNVLQDACHAILWACALDEALARVYGAPYEAFRTGHEAARVIDGVRYARNRVAHQFQVVLEVTSGASFPAELPIVFFEYRWRPSADLPEPDRAGQDGRRASYDAMVAGVPAYRTLRVLEAFFADAHSAFGIA